MKIQFTKMHGAGNDYIYVNADQYPIADPATAAQSLSRPHFGIGSDGLILITRSQTADFRMQMFNADGSEGAMCGNGIRCVGKYVFDHRLTDKTTVTVQTLAGIKTLHLLLGPDGLVSSVRVDMQAPQQIALNQKLQIDGQEVLYHYVSMGNPHAVIFVDDLDKVDVHGLGRKIETHPHFPNRTNVEFAQILHHLDTANTPYADASAIIRMRVWERGSGETLACGTGACATAVAAHELGLVGSGTVLQLLGGDLLIDYTHGSTVFMTGPAQTVFEGVVDIC